jgi:DNA polymerase-3 subunit epsilon
MIERAEMKQAIPAHPGVYLFYDAQGGLLYVGKSVNLRDRVASHFVSKPTNPTDRRLLERCKHIDVQLTGGDLSAQLLEQRLIKERQPLFNQRLRKHRDLFTYQLGRDKTGYLTVSVVPAREVDLNQLDLYYGLFRSQRMGKDRLNKLARQHQLCHRLLGLEPKKKGPCFAYQLHQCSGACVGEETIQEYNDRLLIALAGYQIAVWPYEGPVWIEERAEQKTDYHLIDQWLHLGTFDKHGERQLSLDRQVPFNFDVYRILEQALVRGKFAVKMVTGNG